MLIGVMSDTHDRLPAIDQAISLFEERAADAVIHAGDLIAPFAARRLLRWSGPLHVIFGNNDGERAGLQSLLPQIQAGPLRLKLGGRSILVEHFVEHCEQDEVSRAEVIITGHTHEVVNRRKGPRLFLNPGECCGYLTGKCTVALLDTDALSAEILSLAC